MRAAQNIVKALTLRRYNTVVCVKACTRFAPDFVYFGLIIAAMVNSPMGSLKSTVVSRSGVIVLKDIPISKGDSLVEAFTVTAVVAT